jgi:hypothetical protein
VNDPEPFANNQHALIEHAVLKIIAAKIILVSFSPICERSVTPSFVKGELLRDFVECPACSAGNPWSGYQAGALRMHQEGVDYKYPTFATGGGFRRFSTAYDPRRLINTGAWFQKCV